MKLWKALLMAILAVLLGSYALKLNQPAPQEELQSDALLFPDLDLTALRTLELITPKKRLLLGQLDGRWTFLSPAGAVVKTRQIERLLDTLSRMKVRGSFKPEEPLAAYGLQTPALRINFETTTRPYSLQFGQKHPLTSRRYALTDDSLEVKLLDDYDFATLKSLAKQ